MPKIKSSAPPTPPPQVQRSSPVCILPAPRARGSAQDWGSRNALSTRETEQTGFLMESNESQALESPIAMAAEYPESDKAQSPSLLSWPCPPLPSPCAASSHAWSALRRVNHCKNKEMKGSPIGELSESSSPAWGRGGGYSGRASRRASKTLLPSAGWEPHPTIPRRRRPHNLAPPKGPAEAGGVGQAVSPPSIALQPQPHKTEAQSLGLYHGP